MNRRNKAIIHVYIIKIIIINNMGSTSLLFLFLLYTILWKWNNLLNHYSVVYVSSQFFTMIDRTVIDNLIYNLDDKEKVEM